MNRSELRIDGSEFQRALVEYLKLTKKTEAEALNQKAYSVNIVAAGATAKQTAAGISAIMAEDVQGKAGRSGPRSALIVNATRGSQGLPGLYGQRMKEEADKLTRSRRGHVAFLASGWLPAVAIYAAAIGKAVGKAAARRLEKFSGGKIGGAVPAKEGFTPKAEFWNEAGALETHNAAGAQSMAEAGLQEGLNKATADMNTYLARKMQEASDKFAGRLFR